MPNRPEFKTYNKYVPPIPQPEPTYGFQADDFLAGLQKDPSPDNIPDNALQNIVNGDYIKDQLFVRNGLQVYPVTKPNSLQIMMIFAFFHNDSGINFIRVTPTTLHKAEISGWSTITGPTLHSTNVDKWSFTVADNQCFFSNGASDVIQKLDPNTNTYAPAGNAPKYKYLASAYNRVIGASLRTTIDVPYQLGWSGELNYSEWNPVVDITAGSVNLISSPSDLSDGITGLAPLASTLCILRERSIWLATFVASGTQPFNFFLAVPRIGCDCPSTVQVRVSGLIFYNYQQAALYYYVPGEFNNGQPQDITGPVKRAIKADIQTPGSVYGSYNFDIDTYSLYIPSVTTSITKCYSFNFTTKTWTYNEFYNISSVNDIDYASSEFRIEDLTGTITALTGTIDTLGGLVANANRFFGFNDGTLCSQPLYAGYASESNDIVTTDNGRDITATFDSKTFVNPNFDSYFNTLSLEITPYSTGSISVFYSKDDGETFNLYKTYTFDSSKLNKTQILLCRKPVRARRYIWRVSSSDFMYSLNNYRVFAELAGLSTR